MSTSKRKIGFYSLRLIHTGEGDVEHNVSELKDVIDYIAGLDKKDRKDDNIKSHKLIILDKTSIKDNIHQLLFTSAKYNHTPPLIDKDTAIERASNKKLSEGESEKTHVALKYLSNEIILIMEERRVGITIGKFKDYLLKFAITFYLNKGSKLDFRIDHSPIPKQNFLDELEKLKRVKSGQIFIEKKLLGSDFLNYSNRLEDIKEELILEVTAIRKKSFKDTARDFYNKFASQNSMIKKIRIHGISSDGDESLLDTTVLKRIEYVTVNLNNETGIVESRALFDSFTEILNEYKD